MITSNSESESAEEDVNEISDDGVSNTTEEQVSANEDPGEEQ